MKLKKWLLNNLPYYINREFLILSLAAISFLISIILLFM